MNEGVSISLAPSAAPTGVRVSGITSSSITLQWGPVVCIHRNGNITGYSVWYGTAVGDRPVKMASISALETTITGLMSSTLYDVDVAAVNNADTGVYHSINTQQTRQSKLFSTVVFTALIRVYNII